ncbi:ribose/xylose/arabinose/galactoside ABC-type transport system permease subunit [Nocardioides aromaticivorans]|uniref:Ribose/xylose/arabinose/galactoside ABC-type transport system permease subunit n=1 Tax=Nocardioides aromaticivorans TaxID=200618 RepID=A0A7Y9ZI27_9ACTN|nr:hypothetical protein [Nocardioides aromaticivorans]NYI45275.1 ribose/xylose/arabinose/galactoside ABC-type transport system permease subunit [Nocardioides aromaticivorans]QSR24385.1 hypothetical protein CFH99_01950 [Nocardioides aromaticivorans]
MVIIGLILLLVGVLAILAGVFGSDYDVDGKDRRTTEIIGINVDPEVLFLIGVVSGLLVIAGLWFMKAGAKQGWKRRKEQKRLNELSQKLDEVEAERRREDLSGRDDDS